MDSMEWHKFLFTIEDTLKILDSAPVQRDLIQDVNFIQLTNRAPIAHINIEKAMKVLIDKAGIDSKNKKSHELANLYRELEDCDKEAAEFLSTAFLDAVDCFDINTKFDQFNHLTSLDAYLAKAGTEQVFQELRYWSLGESDRSSLFKFIVLPIHRELLYSLWCFIADENPNPGTVSNRIEREVNRAMYRDMTWGREETEKEQSIRWYTNWLFKEHRSCRDALKEAVEVKFLVKPGDDFITQTLRNSLEILKKSEDAAARHFANTLTYIQKGSQKKNPDAVPKIDWLNSIRSRGEVLTSGGTHLGFIEQGADKSWSINANDGFSGVSEISKSLEDAKNYLVNILTERIDFQVNGKSREFRVIMKQFYERDIGSYSGEIDSLEQDHDIELWDADHGINPGDAILRRFRLEEKNEDSGTN